MRHRLEQRVSKLEEGQPSTLLEWADKLSFEELSRAVFLMLKSHYVELPDAEKKELVALGVELPSGPCEVSEKVQVEVDNWAIHKPEYRPFASKPVWLEDRNHIIGAAGQLCGALKRATLPADIEESVLPLIEKLSEGGSSYQWGYQWPLSDEEIDRVAEAMSGVDLGPEQPWFREYFKAHAENMRPSLEEAREYRERQESASGVVA